MTHDCHEGVSGTLVGSTAVGAGGWRLMMSVASRIAAVEGNSVHHRIC